MPLASWVHTTLLSYRLDVQGVLLSAAPAGSRLLAGYTR